MSQGSLSERDVCTKLITPALERAGWDIQGQVRHDLGDGVQQSLGYADTLGVLVVLSSNGLGLRMGAQAEHLMELCHALEAALRRRQDHAAKLAEAVVQEMVA